MGSADWMKRNLSNRVEAVVPIEDPRLQAQLLYILEVGLADQRQAWEMMPDGRYRRRSPDPRLSPDSDAVIGSHEALMRHTRAVSLQLHEEL